MGDTHKEKAELDRRLAKHGMQAACRYEELEAYPRGLLHRYAMTLTGASSETASLMFRVVPEGHADIVRGELDPALPGMLGLLDESASVLEAGWNEKAWLVRQGVDLYQAPELSEGYRQQWRRIVSDARTMDAFFAPYGGLEDWARWARGLIEGTG
jgi:hypothetical protein